MNYVLMVRVMVNRYARMDKDSLVKAEFKQILEDWLEDPNLKRLRVFHAEDPQEMKNDSDGFFSILRERGELEFIAEGERSAATEKIWSYIEDPERTKASNLSFRASLNRDDSEVKLIFGDQGKCTIYDAVIHEWLTNEYDREMPVQLMRNQLTVSGINGTKLTEHTIQKLEALRHTTGGELTVNEKNALVTFEPKFLMPTEKEILYTLLNDLGQELVKLEMDPLALLAEDAFYYELAQFESRKIMVYSMSI